MALIGETIMKKLIKVAAPAAVLAATAAISTPAFAGNAIVQGFVSPVCEVSIFDEDLYLADSLSAGDSISTGLSFNCNDADGATVSMTSSEGGLESDDQEDLEVEYVATMTAGALTLVLDTGLGGQGNNDVTVDGHLDASGTATAGNLEVVLSDTAPWAGGYSDTISIDITAD